MPKQLIEKIMQRFIPDPDFIKQHKSLQFLGHRLHDPNLWHLNRRSISMAFAVGLFFAWIPSPTQMAMAAVAAFYLRANLPISVLLVWITNPITMPPLFYFAYRVGLWFMNRPSPADDFVFSLDGIWSGLGNIWEPFLLGCLIMAITSSAAGYFGMRYFWAYHVKKQWADRGQRKNPDFVAPENTDQYSIYLQKGIAEIKRIYTLIKTSENTRLGMDLINRLYADIKAVDYAKHCKDWVNCASTGVKTLLNKLN